MDNGIVPNAKRLLWAGFMAILAAGVGFAIRGGIFDNWGTEYGFTGGQLGAIGGYGFTGFCFGIVLGGVVVDKLGYGKLVMFAFVLHIVSALITFMASAPAVGANEATIAATRNSAYNILCIGMFIFAYANGTLEAVANPLIATIFPQNRTHYLNILHASWPAGLVVGGLIGWTLGAGGVNWKIQLGLFLIPTVLYGLAFMGQSFPKSEAAAKGLKVSEMMKEVGLLGSLVACALIGLFIKEQLGGILAFFTKSSFFGTIAWAGISWGIAALLWLLVGGNTRFAVGSFLLFILFITHALVGAVELGTD